MSRHILVTGGNAGIGLALCKSLLIEHGCSVWLGSRDLARGEAAIASLSLPAEVSARCSLIQIDACSDESVAAAAASLNNSLGDNKLYAVVNNAGVGLQAGFEGCINTNLHGPKRVTEAFLPILDPTAGRVVNVGSGAAGMYVQQLGETDAARAMIKNDVTWDEVLAHVAESVDGGADSMVLGGYGLSKAALAQYTQICAREHPEILFSCCSPGFINTAMTAGYGASKEPDDAVPVLAKMLFEDLPGNGYYFGSDGVRSPYHFMRSPGEPEYDGNMPF